ncbi:prostatic acid phosphatase-like [Hyposmocoma kahamanoa]|uniref:prostatic acid phosphatase-like n=1 Tax=Hyposmocoma kahamanoa TaxID=1477025 RepID=UPI000E6D993F|nr:prostatic acid phosphatase-like [Hyposmocoma kahamanoa]
MAQAKTDSIQEEFLPYEDLVVKLEKETGKNFTENPTLFQALFDLYKSQIALGLDLPEWAIPLLPKLSATAKLAYKLYFRNHEMKKIGGGVLLNNFINIAKDIASGSPVSHRLRIFSAHDFNLGALMEVTRTIKDDSIPEYGSAFMLELYKSRITGEFSILPIYLKQAGEVSETLKVEGCERYCELNKFQELTKDFVLPEHEFYQICGIKTEL